jgi:hypothetical protein
MVSYTQIKYQNKREREKMAKKKMERRKSFLVNFKNRAENKGVRNNPLQFVFFDTETQQRFEKKKIGKKTYDTCINTLQMGWACWWNKEEDKEEWYFFETRFEFYTWFATVLHRTQKQSV